MRKRLQNRKGFTLVEMIVVIAIIGILAAIIVPSLIGYVKKTRYDAANTKASQISAAAKLYLQEAEAAGFGMGYPESFKAGLNVPCYKNFVFEYGVYKSGTLEVEEPKDFAWFESFPSSSDSAKWTQAKTRMVLDFAFYIEDNVDLASVPKCVMSVYFIQNKPVRVYYSESVDSIPNLPGYPNGVSTMNGSATFDTTIKWTDGDGFLNGDLYGSYPIVTN